MFNMPSIVLYTKHPCLFFLFLSHNPQKPFISRCGSVLTGAFYIIYTYKSSGFVYFFYYFPGFKSFSFNLSSRIALGQHNEVRLSKFTSLWILGGHFFVCVFQKQIPKLCVCSQYPQPSSIILFYTSKYTPPPSPDVTMLEF